MSFLFHIYYYVILIRIPRTSFADDPNIWKPYSETKNHLSIGANTGLTFQQQFQEARMRFWGNVILELFIWTGK